MWLSGLAADAHERLVAATLALRLPSDAPACLGLATELTAFLGAASAMTAFLSAVRPRRARGWKEDERLQVPRERRSEYGGELGRSAFLDNLLTCLLGILPRRPRFPRPHFMLRV